MSISFFGKISSNNFKGTMCRLLTAGALCVMVSGCVIWPHRSSQFWVSGTVQDNHTVRPIPDVKVEVELPQTGEEAEGRTKRDGKFLIESEGELDWIIWFFADEEPDGEERLELKLSHPQFETETIDDMFIQRKGGVRSTDTGHLYMERKR